QRVHRHFRTPSGVIRGDYYERMFDGTQAADTKAGVSLAELKGLLTRLPHPDPDADDTADIDQIAALEQVKAACAAAQAKLTARIHTTQTTRDTQREIDPAQTARSVGGQVALARHESPHRGNRHLGLALA